MHSPLIRSRSSAPFKRPVLELSPLSYSTARLRKGSSQSIIPLIYEIERLVAFALRPMRAFVFFRFLLDVEDLYGTYRGPVNNDML